MSNDEEREQSDVESGDQAEPGPEEEEELPDPRVQAVARANDALDDEYTELSERAGRALAALGGDWVANLLSDRAMKMRRTTIWLSTAALVLPLGVESTAIAGFSLSNAPGAAGTAVVATMLGFFMQLRFDLNLARLESARQQASIRTALQRVAGGLADLRKWSPSDPFHTLTVREVPEPFEVQLREAQVPVKKSFQDARSLLDGVLADERELLNRARTNHLVKQWAFDIIAPFVFGTLAVARSFWSIVAFLQGVMSDLVGVFAGPTALQSLLGA